MRTPSLLSSVGRLSWIRLSLGSALLAWPLLTLPACGGEEEGSVDDGLEESEAESGDDEETASDSEELRSRDAVPGLKADPTLRFVAMGDTGKGNQGQKDVGAAIAAHCAARGCDFVQLLGDNIYDSGVTSVDDPQWQTKFEEPYKLVTQPFYVVLGNHDYGGDGAGWEFGKGAFEIAYTAKSMKWKLPAAHYRRTVGNVDFFGLDTNLMMYNRDVDKQKTALAGWLASSMTTWKIAFGHHPYLSNGSHGNAGNYDGLWFVPIAGGQGVKKFFDDNVCGKVDLYISGHDHSRQWLTDTCRGTELAVSGAGASGTDLPGRNKNRFQSKELGFLYVTIVGRTLTAEFIDKTGKTEFTRTLTK